jgi:hypothetical protein
MMALPGIGTEESTWGGLYWPATVKVLLLKTSALEPKEKSAPASLSD